MDYGWRRAEWPIARHTCRRSTSHRSHYALPLLLSLDANFTEPNPRPRTLWRRRGVLFCIARADGRGYDGAWTRRARQVDEWLAGEFVLGAGIAGMRWRVWMP